MKRKRNEPPPRGDNVIKYWNEKTKEWSDKLWSVNYNNFDNNISELSQRQWYYTSKQEMKQRNDTKNLRPIACNVAESLDKTIINSISNDIHLNKRSKFCFSQAPDTDHPIRARHIRFFPTKEQKSILRSLLGDARHAYNKCVAQWHDTKSRQDIKSLRDLCSSDREERVKNRTRNNKVIYQSNFHVVDNAMLDFEIAKRAHAAKVEQNPEMNNAFTFKFRSLVIKTGAAREGLWPKYSNMIY